MATSSKIAGVVRAHKADLLQLWVAEQLASPNYRRDMLSEHALREQSREFLDLFAAALEYGGLDDIESPQWEDVRRMLREVSRSRAEQGFTPSETATVVFSLKQPIFSLLRAEPTSDPGSLLDEIWVATLVLDKLGLYTMEVFVSSRQEIISRQQQEMLELSTPVVKVWDGVLALPLIGTLDSARTQVVMESLLQQIVSSGSQVAIIDITGVPTVDTLVAQHLMRTVAAARLMGSECIVSGIRPQIAQTMVHLGVAFGDVITKATLADAIRHAFKFYGLSVIKNATKV